MHDEMPFSIGCYVLFVADRKLSYLVLPVLAAQVKMSMLEMASVIWHGP